MKNSKLFNVIKDRTKDQLSKGSNKFNTNDFILEILLDKKIDRNEVVLLITEERLKRKNIDENHKNFDSILMKEFKTSKNGLDTSVSDSNNNSSFSYNQKYEDYELIKDGSKIGVIKKSNVK
jgi:hypothetical protein